MTTREVSVEQIVTAFLRANGYDGLYSDYGECACDVDGLAPCGILSQECCAGYRVPCDCEDHDFHITSERPSERRAP